MWTDQPPKGLFERRALLAETALGQTMRVTWANSTQAGEVAEFSPAHDIYGLPSVWTSGYRQPSPGFVEWYSGYAACYSLTSP